MSERARNKSLMVLLSKLQNDGDLESIELLRTMVANDTESMKKSFEIVIDKCSYCGGSKISAMFCSIHKDCPNI
jgi:hypothetical protein